MRKRAFIIGLAGASGTGKSTVAKRLAARLNGYTVSMETYSLSTKGLSLEEREKLNYDEPDVIDVGLLRNDIRKYSAGKDIESPVNDFANHLRVCEFTEHVPASPPLIAKGILALHFVSYLSPSKTYVVWRFQSANGH
jgi:uridine kinase